MLSFFHSLMIKIMSVFIGTTIAVTPTVPAVTPTRITQPQQQTSPILAATDTTEVSPVAAKKPAPQAPAKPQPKISTNVAKTVTTPVSPPSVPETVSAPKTMIVTLPSGAVIEVDSNGNFVRRIKDAPTSTNSTPIPPPPQTISTQATSAPAPTTVTAPLAIPKYGIEYQNFTNVHQFDGPWVAALHYRLKSSSTNAPDIVKIVSRIFVVVDNDQAMQNMDTWVRGWIGHGDSFNDSTGLSYLGTAKVKVDTGATSIFQDVLIFKKTEYQVSIPANNVSPDLLFQLKAVTLYPSSMRIDSVSIFSTDGNTYSASN
jgi:hypothetical protein